MSRLAMVSSIQETTGRMEASNEFGIQSPPRWAFDLLGRDRYPQSDGRAFPREPEIPGFRNFMHPNCD